MNETIQFVAHHGYWLLIGAVLGRQACLPIPANLLLVAAGALAHSGKLSLLGIFSVSVMTFLLADLAWYEGGRRSGDRILHFICGLSRNPEACVYRASRALGGHGAKTLLFSKFVIGLDAVAAPMAGMTRIPLMHFLVFDAVGALFWSVTYTAPGYIFSDQLDRVAVHVARMGAFVACAAVVGFGFYLVRKLVRWGRFVRQFKLARITPEELKAKLNAGEDILVVDLQGRPHHSDEPMAIAGAVRINPRNLEQYRDVAIPPSREVVLYCDCPGEIASARVALALRRKGVERVRPLAGGLQAWRDRGFPVTSKVSLPPSPVIQR